MLLFLILLLICMFLNTHKFNSCFRNFTVSYMSMKNTVSVICFILFNMDSNKKFFEVKSKCFKITCFKGVVVFFFWFLFFLAGFLFGVPFGLSEVSEMSPFFRACYENTNRNIHVTE